MQQPFLMTHNNTVVVRESINKWNREKTKVPRMSSILS